MLKTVTLKRHCVRQIKQALVCDAVSQNKANWEVCSGSWFVNKINIYFMQLSSVEVSPVKSYQLPMLTEFGQFGENPGESKGDV